MLSAWRPTVTRVVSATYDAPSARNLIWGFAMLDLVIKGGTVIDGSGRPGVRADVGIKDGRVVRIGEVTEDAAKTIDATGKIVAPGFIDIHTHYDAQAFWDSNLSPSPLHGITTVIGGNCGFTIAPLEMEHGEYLMKMLARVEGMPLTSLETGVPWGSWHTFGEWLDCLEGKLAVNAGFMVGHSALRRNVMGERSIGNHATDDELAAMQRLLAESLEGGGLGFTSSWATSHNDAQGDPVPSRHASREEMIALAGVCRDFDGTNLEFIPTVGRFEQHHIELLTDMSLAANRPINWNLIAVNLSPKQMEAMNNRLSATDYARAHGAEVLALTVPCAVQSRLCLESGFTFDMLNGWAKPMALPVDEKMALLADPSTRRELGELAQGPSPMRGLAKWHRYTIGEVFSDENKDYSGRTDRRDRRGRGPRDLRRAVRHRGRRPAQDRPLPAGDRRRRRDLAEARRGLARQPHGRGRHRRRRPPRPAGHLQRHHRHARQGRAASSSCCPGRRRSS